MSDEIEIIQEMKSIAYFIENAKESNSIRLKLADFYYRSRKLQSIVSVDENKKKIIDELLDHRMEFDEQNYLAGSPISASKKGHEIIKRLAERNIDLSNYGFINLGGGDGTELFVEIENTVSNFGLLLEYDYAGVNKFSNNQIPFYLKNSHRKIHTDVIECDLGDKKKLEVAKKIIGDNNLDGIVVTIHAVLHELSTRSQFKPFDFVAFFKRIYDLHDNIILFIREPGVAENWPNKVKIVLNQDHKNDFIPILKRVNEIHFKNDSSNYEVFGTGEIHCNSILAIEALTNFFYKEDFEYEKDEQHTSISKTELLSDLKASKFEILESEPFYTESMKRNIQHFEIKTLGTKDEHISYPQCFTYTVAQKGNLEVKKDIKI